MSAPKNLGPVRLLSELRSLRHMTQHELAERMGTLQSTVSKIERRTDPTLSTLRHYAEALGGELSITVRFANGVVEYSLGEDGPPSSR